MDNLGASYIEPMSFEDYYHQNSGFGVSYSASNSGSYKHGIQNPYSLLSKIGNFFTGNVDRVKDDYAKYLSDIESNNDQWKINQANARTEQREDTAPERMVAAYERAGLSPYLITGSGLPSGSSSQAQASSYRKPDFNSEASESKLANTAIKVLSLLVLKTMFVK